MGIFDIFKSDNTRNVKKLEKIAAKVEALEEKFKDMSTEELQGMTAVLKGRLANKETLDDILPEAFATIREASARVLNKRHYHVQILGGIALYQGRIAEMRTGEGKTLVETLPAYLIALEGKGVHIVTVNEYLSKRDSEWMGKIFKFLGLTVGVSTHDMNPDEKRKAYAADITYSTNNELGFDYLRDNMARRPQDRVARGYHFAIVDEVDSILIDEARTPLIISGPGMKSSEDYYKAAKFAKSLKADDYEIDEEKKAIRLLDSGVEKAERYYNLENLTDIDNIEINHYINNAIRAQFIMHLDNDYIIRDNQIYIVDEFTGRVLEGRRYSNGLHQAIEAKEGLEVKDENVTLATVTFQNFFRIYEKVSGMTGTAKSEETEFNKIYSLDVVSIPTNKPLRRIDWPDAIYPTEAAKFRAIVEEVKEVHATGRPVLIGTITIEKSELIASELKKAGIKHTVLNAKNHELESEIVAQAGRMGQVTIATNMAGRGTDILLGGNPEFLAKKEMEKLGCTPEEIDFCTSFVSTDNKALEDLRTKYNAYYEQFEKVTNQEKEKVSALGGLHIIGTERHESRRIDDQLRGRAGRQGDPGSSIFYVSMQDDLMKRFGGDKLKSIVDFFKVEEDTRFSMSFLSKQIENAQRRIEGFNFSARHNVLKYDDVNNTQRMEIYKERNRVLDGADIHNEIIDMIDEYAKNLVYDATDGNENYEEWNVDHINSMLNGKVFPQDYNFVTEDMIEGLELEELANNVAVETIRLYEDKCQQLKEINVDYKATERSHLLRVVDTLWRNHIEYMETLRKEIGLRAYGNHDPIIAYKKDCSEAFDKLVSKIREETAMFLININIDMVRDVIAKATKAIKEQMARAKAQAEAEAKNKDKSADSNAESKPSEETPSFNPFEAQRSEQKMFTNKDEGETKKQARSSKTVGRNDPCPCGSGKKYKACCGKNQ